MNEVNIVGWQAAINEARDDERVRIRKIIERKKWKEKHEQSCEIFQIPEIPRCSCEARESWIHDQALQDILKEIE